MVVHQTPCCPSVHVVVAPSARAQVSVEDFLMVVHARRLEACQHARSFSSLPVMPYISVLRSFVRS